MSMGPDCSLNAICKCLSQKYASIGSEPPIIDKDNRAREARFCATDSMQSHGETSKRVTTTLVQEIHMNVWRI